MGIPEISWNSRIEAVAKTGRQTAKQKFITPGINQSETKHERAIIFEHKRSNLTQNPILSKENWPKRQNFVSTSPEHSDTKPYSRTYALGWTNMLDISTGFEQLLNVLFFMLL